jgi:hypothetical protein
MTWTAGFRGAVISPYEGIKFSEPRGFADQTVRQVLRVAHRRVRRRRRRGPGRGGSGRPDSIRPDLDAGDGMHLNDRGAEVMADAVPVEVLGRWNPADTRYV